MVDIGSLAGEAGGPVYGARITRLRNGTPIAPNCIMRYQKPVSVDEAVALFAANKVAFVNREDAKAVLAIVNK
jgi:hypothetical protein